MRLAKFGFVFWPAIIVEFADWPAGSPVTWRKFCAPMGAVSDGDGRAVCERSPGDGVAGIGIGVGVSDDGNTGVAAGAGGPISPVGPGIVVLGIPSRGVNPASQSA